jgi:alcohol oxidase
MLIAEDLGYSGDALKMTVPTWHNGTYETTGRARL